VEYVIPILRSGITIMTPLLLAAMGGLFTELAGMLNIALEGLLLLGAFAAVAGAHFSGTLAGGVLAAVLGSTALAALLGVITLRLRANVFITGLAANLCASGLTAVLSARLFATRGVVILRDLPRLKPLSIPGLAEIPLAGDILSGHTAYVYWAWVLLFAAWLILYRCPFGFRLRAGEKHEQALVSLGIRPGVYRFAAFLISGVTCGIGGSFLSLNLGAFVPNMAAGKGWIALVVIFLGNRKPWGLLLAALIFGTAEAFSNHAQGILQAPSDFILAIPYIFTLLVMIGGAIYGKRKNKFLAG
jgi:simple sugar transport system permease protein